MNSLDILKISPHFYKKCMGQGRRICILILGIKGIKLFTRSLHQLIEKRTKASVLSFFTCFFSLTHGKLFSVTHAKKLLGVFFLRSSACVLFSIVRIFRSLVCKALMSGFN